MKKILKIAGIIIEILVVLAIVLGIITERVDGPRQSFAFVNSSDEKKAVTFEKILDDGSYEDGYYTNTTIEPGITAIDRLPPGNYRITVWDTQDEFYGEVGKYHFNLPDTKSSYDLIHFNPALDKKWAVVTLNHMYQGNALSESLSSAMGTNRTSKQAPFIQVRSPFRLQKVTKTGHFWISVINCRVPSNSEKWFMD